MMTISCTVESFPVAQVTWLKNGEPLIHKDKNIITIKSGISNSLTLVALDEADFGNYTCVAENKFGIMKESVRISGMFFL